MTSKQKRILVVGGAGFIGSIVNKMLHRAGYETVVLDNLSTGSKEAVVAGTFIQGDMGDAVLLDRIFSEYTFDAVMHFAALIDVGESVVDPAKYYHNNVVNTLTLLDAMRRHQIFLFIFSSSAAVYGIPQSLPLTEKKPCVPISPYGVTKLIVENILKDYDAAYGLRSCSLRYFNAAGGDPDGEIKNYKPKESNLIPIVLRSLLPPTKTVVIFGTDYPTPDGTCIRDYIHVYDLGTAHIAAMEQLFHGAPSSTYNLGNGKGFSVSEVIAAAECVTGLPIKVEKGPRRAGDPPSLVADASLAKRELAWEPRYPTLEPIISDAWNSLHSRLNTSNIGH